MSERRGSSWRLVPMLLVFLVACGEQPPVDDPLASARGESENLLAARSSTEVPASRLVPVGGSVVSILADLRVPTDWYDDEFRCVLGDRIEKHVARDDQALRVSVVAKVPTGIKLEFELRPTESGPPTIAVAASSYTDVRGGAGAQRADITWGVVYVTTSNVLAGPLEMKFHLLLDKGGKRVPVSGGLVVE